MLSPFHHRGGPSSRLPDRFASSWAPSISLVEMRANLAANGPELYVGADGRGLVWAGPEQSALVLGPPRSGKTSAVVVPNVLAAPGAVVVTSTKQDVLRATLASRQEVGKCWVMDASGTIGAPAGTAALRWSPVQASLSWEEALVTARVMTAAARPGGYFGESAHWTERAEALLAPLLHAAALSGAGMRQVLGWVLRQDLYNPKAALDGVGAVVASDVLAGILSTEDREKSGIFSTAAGVLGAYRSERALEAADEPNFDPGRFPASGETVYICAPARYQALTAPVAVAFLEQVRAATYQAASVGWLRLPVTLVLDEVANIAPLPDLPAMVSEGGGQGLLTLACLQDLSQARGRWGQAAEGFFSLFGTKVVLAGIGDMKTLEAVSHLCGQVDVPVRSVNASAWWSGRPSASTTWSWRRQPRLPVDQARSLPTGSALVLAGARPPRLARLTPWWAYPPFAEARLAPALPARPPEPPAVQRRGQPLPPSPPPGQGKSEDISVEWHKVPGRRRLHPPPPRF
ncbi:MAG: type IV secretory system conjugative DNA transfer family protein [Actinomycetota bacterium]|nr:type IV secretory system conjugative DNA transfer family protein [Actinomycetota bacterium]